MKFRHAVTITSLFVVLSWAPLLAQQNPSSQSPAQNPPGATQDPAGAVNSSTSPGASSTSKATSEKQKRWSGSLVDVGCMAKALSTTASGSTPAASTDTAVPHLLSPAPGQQPGQQPAVPSGAGNTPGMQSPATRPTYPGEAAGNNGMSPEQQAQMARAAKVDDAAKQCVPTSSTRTFGLAMSGGQVVRFDNDGNSKVQAALKNVAVQPGKKVKAKVTGTMQDATTVRVDDVEVKGKRAGGSASNAGGSGS